MMNEKIFANEMLSDEQLEKVSGGNIGQTAEDSALLYAYGLLKDYHGEWHMLLNWKSDSAEVDAGWAKAGITSVTTHVRKRCGGYNKYFLNGKEITRDEAINHLKTKFLQIHEIP